MTARLPRACHENVTLLPGATTVGITANEIINGVPLLDVDDGTVVAVGLGVAVAGGGDDVGGNVAVGGGVAMLVDGAVASVARGRTWVA